MINGLLMSYLFI